MGTNAKRGNDFVLKMAPTFNGSTYTQVAALTATSLTINNTNVDISNKDTNGWAESMPGGGLKSMNISAEGIYSNGAGQRLLLEASLATTLWKCQIVDGAGNTFTGTFHIESLTFEGAAFEAQTFSASFISSDEVTIVLANTEV